MHQLLNEATAAKLLHLQPPTLRRWRFTGKGPAYFKVGGAVRYQSTDLEAFAAKGRVAAND